MKKIMTLLTVIMCFASITVFAQEVRGIETRRVIYDDGKPYGYEIIKKNGQRGGEISTKYYGWEFTNLNSCEVSVDIALHRKAYIDRFSNYPDIIVTTKSIVLQSKEKYIFKPEIYNTQVIGYDGYERNDVEQYYVEYKAFKLQ